MKPIRNPSILSLFQTPQHPCPGAPNEMCPWPETLEGFHELGFCGGFEVFDVSASETGAFLHGFEEVALRGEESVVALVVDYGV